MFIKDLLCVWKSLGAGDTVVNKAGSLPSGCLHFKEKRQELNSQMHGRGDRSYYCNGCGVQMGEVKGSQAI